MFQTFDDPAGSAASGERVARLRESFEALAIDGFIVPRADEHQGEYIPDSAARLAWLTGFTGSAGVALVLKDSAVIFTDGRYTVQVRTQVDGDVFEIESSVTTPLSDYLRQQTEGLRIGFDPWLHTIAEAKRLSEALAETEGRLVPVADNPLDAIWTDRSAPPRGRIWRHPDRFAGRPAADKLEALRSDLAKKGAAATVMTDPSSIAWTFNIRGSDVPHTPLPLSFAILPANGQPSLFVDPAKLDDEVRAYLSGLCSLDDPAGFEAAVADLARGRKVLLDPALTAERLRAVVEEAGGTVVEGADPARLPRAIKNEAEIAGSRAAHRRDGAAVTEFLFWLDTQAPGSITEIVAAEKLERLRDKAGEATQMPLRDVSFDTISGAGPNGAIVHYRVTRQTDRPLQAGELYLVDSGAQYEDGTTDITRTVVIGGEPSADMREKFTLVLKGVIALSIARFPKGTRGMDLDPIVRIALWKAGCDFAHGTGHGIGSYLAVHEGPQSISRRGTAEIEPNMIISNEPGYYREGAFGIRTENLILVKDATEIPGGDRPMMSFETLTLAPIDRRLILPELLSPEEIAWLDAYHATVREELAPLLDQATSAWLESVTAPLGA
ncbi:aminopeptidase P family protein [Consotaella aegiceratis]|uniref:aminopeptidase P family protein n=1 Tax=Consotaella aegiceratis TaxID=3097961 RepID=UPI002F42FD9A